MISSENSITKCFWHICQLCYLSRSYLLPLHFQFIFWLQGQSWQAWSPGGDISGGASGHWGRPLGWPGHTPAPENPGTCRRGQGFIHSCQLHSILPFRLGDLSVKTAATLRECEVEYKAFLCWGRYFTELEGFWSQFGPYIPFSLWVLSPL